MAIRTVESEDLGDGVRLLVVEVSYDDGTTHVAYKWGCERCFDGGRFPRRSEALQDASEHWWACDGERFGE